MKLELSSLVSIGLTLLAGIASVVAIYTAYFDKPRIKVKSIIPAMSGSRNNNSAQWNYQITSIEVTLINKGNRPVVGCTGIIYFLQLEALPIHPVTIESLVDHKNLLFNVEARSSTRLNAAWHYTETGAIDGIKQALSFDEFISKCIPLTVMIKIGDKKIKAVLSKKDALEFFKNQQINMYLG